MIKAKLIVVGGDAKRTDVHLKNLPATIGRAREATITLPHPLVSRQHCEIFEHENQLFVKDLDSLNGTYLNNEKIAGLTTLLPGQLLTLGNVTFRADYEVVSGSEANGAAINPPVQTEAVNDNGPTEGLDHDETIGIQFSAQDVVKSSAAMQTGEKANKPDSAADYAAEIDTDHGTPTSSPKKKKAFKSDSDLPLEQDDTGVHKFVFDGESIDAAKPVSFGAIADLPDQEPAASFAGNIEVEDDPKTGQINPDAVIIDLGVERLPSNDPSQSSLDDFLRKMPK